MSLHAHWTALPLHGKVLIEASAGTGKTFQIALLYLRLLLERGAMPDQILVCTFTEAAAAELRERIRARVSEAEMALAPQAPVASPVLDPWLDGLATGVDGRQRLWQQLRLARLDLDRAPIGTIHGSCARFLREHSFASGARFGATELVDEAALRDECFDDFRRQILHAPAAQRPPWASVLLKEPQPLRRALQELANNPGAHVIPPPATSLVALDAPLAALPQATVEALQRLLHLNVLHGGRKFGKRLKLLLEGQALGNDACADLSEENFLAGCKRPLGPEWSPLLQPLFALAALAAGADRIRRGQALAAARAWVTTELERRLQAGGGFGFGGLINRCWEALRGTPGALGSSPEPSGPATHELLARNLARAHPHILIDEFQDTDQRQFEIFEAIHAAGADDRSLHLIGDPKQAIYGFRGGDTAVYTRAASAADVQRFTLGTNWRSSAALVASLNALYGASSGGFADPLVQYQTVQCGGGRAHKPYCLDQLPITTGLSLHVDPGPEVHVVAAERRCLEACAETISQLLTGASHRIDGKLVQPGDIAVLLETNFQVRDLRLLLERRGVPCVGAGRANVLEGDMAEELELLLAAMLHPADDAALRGALSTELLGLDLPALRALEHDVHGWELQARRFEAWARCWREDGILALIERLIEDRAAALLQLPQGERRLTDLRHLGELLLEQSVQCYGPPELLVRLRQLRRDPPALSSTIELRLESDAARVKLLTLHGSKGLEFPLVFLPLLWRARNSRDAPMLARFHDPAGQLCFDLGSEDFDRHLELAGREARSEQLRLLYVGLTRAEYAVHVFHSEQWYTRGEGDSRGVLTELLDDIGRGAGLAAALSTLQAQRAPIRIIQAFPEGCTRWNPRQAATAQPRAREQLPAIRSAFLMHSFSALTQGNVSFGLDAQAALDELPLAAPLAAPVTPAVLAEPPVAAIVATAGLRGARFGNAAHSALELADLSQPLWPEQAPLLAQQLRSQGFAVEGETDARVAVLGEMLERVRRADLGAGRRLADLRPADQVHEFEFHFAVNGVRPQELRRIARHHGFAELVPAQLLRQQLKGLLTGFVDLVCRWQGRYYIVDYKSNWLGDTLADYRGAALTGAVRQSAYDLQALIYSIALHRYLRQRLSGYQPELHLGGTLIVFLRAAGLAPDCGVHNVHFPAALLADIDAAFAADFELYP